MRRDVRTGDPGIPHEQVFWPERNGMFNSGRKVIGEQVSLSAAGDYDSAAARIVGNLTRGGFAVNGFQRSKGSHFARPAK
jgi:hypothetical protein